MKKGKPRTDPGVEKQLPLHDAKKKADQAGPFGKQAHEISERANMKRQQKQMHQQSNK